MSTTYAAIQLKVAELEQKLLTKHPSMPLLLRDIHAQLKQNPEVVTLMSETEIAAIVAGLSEQTSTHLAGSMMKSAKSPTARAAMKKVSTDDLGF